MQTVVECAGPKQFQGFIQPEFDVGVNGKGIDDCAGLPFQIVKYPVQNYPDLHAPVRASVSPAAGRVNVPLIAFALLSLLALAVRRR